MENSPAFIVDMGVGKTIENWLKHAAYSVFSISQINPEMQDDEIISLANKQNAIIITMDKDFGELVFKKNMPHKGILLLRLDDAVAEEKLAVIQSLFPGLPELIKDKFAVFQNGVLRIK
ncbi:MAG TPA: DUF5615 family PIN-like protein [Ferruginibacter sp.]|nr:DUF5615 family PIN-like protein [Ferruginibacter sp.]